MTFQPRHAYPVAMWEEPPALLGGIIVLTPYLLIDGSVRFLARTDPIPAGAVEASVVDSGAGHDEIVTPAAMTGRRVVMRADGNIFFS